MRTLTEVAVIGAGPYGLSLAAHFRAAGIDFRIFGYPMDAWRNHMPEGMLLKSDGFASDLYHPGAEFPLARYCRERGLPYDDRGIPVRRDTFAEYGQEFRRRFVPDLKETLVVSLIRERGGFRLTCEDGEIVRARRVAVAAGIGPFRFFPAILSRVEPKFVSHSYDHCNGAAFAGRRVAVIGAGASAIDLAVELRDHDCDVHLICRTDSPKFGSLPSNLPRSTWQRIRHPSSGLGPGWRSRLSTDAPLLFHSLPAAVRLPIVRRHLGPAASGHMRERFIGRVSVLSGRELLGAAAESGKVNLSLRTREGKQEVASFDHVIAATGYRIDIDRLDFLNERLRREMACADKGPALSTCFESSIEGLFFVGPVAANSFGPLMRFVFGARFASRRIVRALTPISSVAAARAQSPAAFAP